MQYSIAQQSFQGGREYNEDRTAIFEHDGSTLLVLADGLGGHAGGALASQTFVEAISDSFSTASSAQLDDCPTFLTLSITYAHRMIHRRAKEQGYEVDSPKTTCVVCLIRDGVARWGHSGDSRLYMIRNKEIIHRTTDHVVDKGPHANHPINRCVGGIELPKPEISKPIKLEKGDTIMLATDGAWHSFKSADLTEYVDPEHPQFGVDNLLQTLESRNKMPSDNLSMVLMFWGQKQLDRTDSLIDSPLTYINAKEASNDKKKQISQEMEKATFDMKNLDKTINEIESFISELDDKL